MPGTRTTAAESALINAISRSGAFGSKGDGRAHASIGDATTRTPRTSPSHQVLNTVRKDPPSPNRTPTVAPTSPPANGPSTTAQPRYATSAPRGRRPKRRVAFRSAEAPANGSVVLARANPIPN